MKRIRKILSAAVVAGAFSSGVVVMDGTAAGMAWAATGTETSEPTSDSTETQAKKQSKKQTRPQDAEPADTDRQRSSRSDPAEGPRATR